MSLIGFAGKLIPRAIRERIVLGQIRSALKRLGLTPGQQESVMSGWKTWAGGIGVILGGLAIIVKEIADGTFNFANIMQGVTVIGGGLSVLGIGHKVEKAGNANPAADPFKR